MLSKTVLTAAAVSFAAVPAVAQANEVERASSGITSAEAMVGEGSTMFYLLGFLATLAAIVVIAGEDNEEPASP